MTERRLNRRQIIAGAALASFGVDRAAAQGTEVVRGGVPLVALPAITARLLDPADDGWAAAWLRSLLYDTPFRPRVTGQIVAAAGIGFELDLEAQLASFACRTTMPFASGALVTAADIAASIERAIETSTATDAWRWERIERVGTASGDGVAIHLREVDATLAASLASPLVPVTPGGAGRPDAAFTDLPAGTGPFVPSRDDDGTLRFRPHRGHWVTGQPRFDGCNVIAVPQQIERTSRLVTGLVDVVPDVPSLDIPLLENDPGLALVGGTARRTCAVVVNLARKPLDDERVRLAIASVIDRASLVEGATAGTAVPARSLVPPDHWAGSVELETGEAEPAADVRDVLAAFGLLPGWSLRLACPDDTPVLANAAVLLQEQLAAAGIAVGIDLLDRPALDAARTTGDFDLMMTLLPLWIDPHELVHPWLHSMGARNDGGFASDRVDRFLDRARGATEPEVRGSLYIAIQQIMVSQVPLIPLFRTPWVDGVRADIAGYSLYPPPSGRGIASAWFERP